MPRSERLNGKRESWSTNVSIKDMHSADFQRISDIVYRHSGIRLNTGKEELVRSRLVKRLHGLGISDFAAYVRHIQEDQTAQELRTLIDCLTTNKTSFFRENRHFEFLRTQIFPELSSRGSRCRIWSAGCSSGEEPYSIAMLLDDQWPNIQTADVRILATDISDTMLGKARSGNYEKENMAGLPPSYLLKYFDSRVTSSEKIYRVREKVKKYVRFARLNLMDDWPMKGPFDVIFCRNVMIYFDSPSQRRLVQRFYRLLAPGGYFMVGHSESLLANAGGFKYIRPATYQK